MSSSPLPAHREPGAPLAGRLSTLDERAERGIDQALRLASGGLRIPAAFVALMGPDGQVLGHRLCESGVWESLAGTPGLDSLIAHVAAAAVARGGSRDDEALRGRVGITELGMLEYAALPLRQGEGNALVGVLAAVDRRQRDWGMTQDEMLRDIAGIIESELEWLQARSGARETGGLDQLMAGLLESSGEGIAVFDAERRCRVWNRFMERLTNRAAGGVLGLPAAELERLFRVEELDMLLARAIAAGESATVEDQLYRTDGEDGDVWVTVRISPLRSGGGAATGAVVMLTDETARVRADQRRQRGERMFRKLIEHSSEMLSILAPDGTILFDSPANERILGYPVEELVGRSMLDLAHPDDAERVRAALERAVGREGASVTIEFRARHANGDWRELLTVGQNLSSDPFVRGVVLNSRDITEWRAMEAQLNQARKMDALGRLAGGVAHDFNNLLTAIKGNVQLLMMDLPADGPGREEMLEIDRVTDRAAALTRQLLAFGRRQAAAPATLDLNAVVRQTIRMLQRLVGGIQLDVRLAEPLPPVHADPSQLDQVLVNLVVNARDAMPDGGTIQVETRACELPPDLALAHPESSDGLHVCLRVRDSGAGMDRETQARMFEPFFTTKASGKGTGLGLATVYSIVRQSAGYIRVSSEVGEGTTVEVYFRPAAPQA